MGNWYAVRVLGGREKDVLELIKKIGRRKGIGIRNREFGKRRKYVVISVGGKERLRLSVEGAKEVEVLGKRGTVKVTLKEGVVKVGDREISEEGERIVKDGVEVKIKGEGGFLPGYLVLESEGDLLSVIERVPYASNRLLRIREKDLKKRKAVETGVFRIEEGDYVEVILGEFKGFKGRVKECFEKEGKVAVLLNILGEEREVLFKVSHLRKI